MKEVQKLAYSSLLAVEIHTLEIYFFVNIFGKLEGI